MPICALVLLGRCRSPQAAVAMAPAKLPPRKAATAGCRFDCRTPLSSPPAAPPPAAAAAAAASRRITAVQQRLQLVTVFVIVITAVTSVPAIQQLQRQLQHILKVIVVITLQR